ncbi:MAG: GxxExxY protein [Bacteroidota bacterium]
MPQKDKRICEINTIDTDNPVWKVQIISHLKLTSNRLEYLINYNMVYIAPGIKRLVR